MISVSVNAEFFLKYIMSKFKKVYIVVDIHDTDPITEDFSNYFRNDTNSQIYWVASLVQFFNVRTFCR